MWEIGAVAVVVFMSMLAWVFQALYYKLGHPWKEVNFPYPYYGRKKDVKPDDIEMMSLMADSTNRDEGGINKWQKANNLWICVKKTAIYKRP